MTRRPSLPFTQCVKGRWYFRRRGVSAPLGGNPATDAEAGRRYWAILQGRVETQPTHTVREVIASLKRSPRWLQLAPGSRTTYSYSLRSIEDKAGMLDIRTIKRAHMIKERDRLSNRPGAANMLLAVWAVLFEMAIDLGYRNDNPAKGVDALKGGEGHIPWPLWALDWARSWGHPWFRTYLELGVGTGQRPGDLRAMRWGDIEDDGIHVRQEKTGAELWIPFTRSLSAYLATLQRTAGPIVAWPDGRHVSKAQAAWAVSKLRDANPMLRPYTPHGWRYNAASELADAGCTDAEIAAITGHKGRAMVVKYSSKTGQRQRARKAQERRQ